MQLVVAMLFTVKGAITESTWLESKHNMNSAGFLDKLQLSDDVIHIGSSLTANLSALFLVPLLSN